MAHTDEVGFAVERILGDGIVTLTRVGGAVASAWEGQEAVLYFDRNPGDAAGAVAEPRAHRPVFVPRDTARTGGAPLARPRGSASTRRPSWRAVLIGAAGDRVDTTAERLGALRITGQPSDDRTGSATLLILAVRAIDPATLTAQDLLRVGWTGEEAGLLGARAFGEKYGTTLARAYAIDTFVSGDTLLELARLFALNTARQGSQCCADWITALSSRAPRRDSSGWRRRRWRIPLQLGTT